MSNVGLLAGLNTDTWHRYEPKLISTTATVGPGQQPITDTTNNYPNGNPFGRYLIADHNYVIVEIQLGWTGAFTIGTPNDDAAWLFKLPFPANRWTGAGQPSLTPLGLGMAYFSFQDPQATVPMVVTLANPFATLNGTEDEWIQCYCPHRLIWGTGTLTSSSTTTTVQYCTNSRTFDLPRPEDIELVYTSVTSTASVWPYSIQNITTSTFDIVHRNFPAGGVTYAYKIKAKPPTGATGPLLGPTMPWDWTRATVPPFGWVFLQCAYEARR